MNSLHLYLAVGFGIVGVVVIAVIWSIRRMPSEAELEDQCRRHLEAAARRDTDAAAGNTDKNV